MAVTNQFLPWATGGGANVNSFATYLALAERLTGFSAGLAKSIDANSAIRQSTFVTAAIAQFMSDTLAANVNDDGNSAEFEAQFIAALQAKINAAIAAFVPPTQSGLFLGETLLTGGATGNFTAAAAANTLEIFATAGGGGGGGAPATGAGQLSGGGGGGGGAFSKVIVTRAAFPTWFAAWAYTVGQGGGVSLGVSGSAGGNTSLNSNILTGGGGGQSSGPTSSGELTGAVGAGGNAATIVGTSVINLRGRDGQQSTASITQGVFGIGGLGYDLGFGDGGIGTVQGASLPALAGNNGKPGGIRIRQYT